MTMGLVALLSMPDCELHRARIEIVCGAKEPQRYTVRLLEARGEYEVDALLSVHISQIKEIVKDERHVA